jgi:OOP family OmpA-OmpF porin
MKFKTFIIISVIGVLCSLLITGPVRAAEILTVEDFKQNIVTVEHLIKTADNAIIMFDASSSMEKPFKGTNTPKIKIISDFLQERNTYFPDLGYNFGLYVYTPEFSAVYPAQPWDRQKFADAIAQLPSEAKGPTLLQQGLNKIEPALQKLTGRTAMFIPTDGTYSKFEGVKDPVVKAQELADKYDVCFYLISTADTKPAVRFLQDMASVNACSRVIPLESFIDRPAYISGALYVVKSNIKLVTLSDKKVVGLKTEPILFDYNVFDVHPDYYQELNEIGAFMQSHPEAYALIDGYSDNIGSVDYNLRLSRKRAESVASYLANRFKITADQIVVVWYGQTNPATSNATAEGRMQNRRVEIAIGGLE